MKPIKCEVREPIVGGSKVTYHKSIRKAMKYCKANGIAYKYIWRQE